MTQRRAHGFTLIELLTVIAIICLLATLTIAVGAKVRERARITRAKSMIHNIRLMMETYKALWREYPGPAVPSAAVSPGAPAYPDTWPYSLANNLSVIYPGAPLERDLVFRGTSVEEGAFTQADFHTDPLTGTQAFVDPWGNSLYYRKLSPDRILIWSFGPNGKQEIGIGQVWDTTSKTYKFGMNPDGVTPLASKEPGWEKMGDDISMVDTDY